MVDIALLREQVPPDVWMTWVEQYDGDVPDSVVQGYIDSALAPEA